LAQALAKQAKECVRSANKHTPRRKPQLHNHTTTLYYHFVIIESYNGDAFDFAVKVSGSGAPDVILPVHSTAHLNGFLNDGWKLSKTIRLGRRGDRLFVDFLLEKPRPPLRIEGHVVGMDSNYKAGFVFSDGQVVGQEIHARIQQFKPRQKHTHAEIRAMVGHALKQVDLSNVKLLAIENLKYVKHGKRGKFSRGFNRRLSHWLCSLSDDLLSRAGEEQGFRLERKNPWKTSQFCPSCRKWDRRNRVESKFLCANCGHEDDADHNSSKNLELLGVAGVYGLRSLISSGCAN
jgi:transposase